MPAIPTIVQYVAFFAPQFSADARLSTAIALAENAHTSSGWGNRYTEAMARYAIHVLRTSPVDDDAGTAEDAASSGTGDLGVRSKTTGQYSITWGSTFAEQRAAAGGTDDEVWLSSTKDGRAFLAIRKTREAFAAPSIVDVAGPPYGRRPYGCR